MAVSKALKRLLRIRELEEEQQRLALEAATGTLRGWEQARDFALAQERVGHDLVRASVGSGEPSDRHVGLTESRNARKKASHLAMRVRAAETEMMRLRQSFLEKRTERRQAETLIEQEESQEALESGRRSQQTVDDWYGARMGRERAKTS